MNRSNADLYNQILRILLAVLVLLAFSLGVSPSSNLLCAAAPNISAPKYVLMDAATGQVLLERNATELAYPASTTKILTAYVVLSKTNLQNSLVVPKEAKVGGSHIFLAEADILSLDDALFGLMLASANDAAVTLAHAVSGDVHGFAELMNSTAEALGATHSNFTNPHGLPDDDHYTTALDLAVITQAALGDPAFARLVGTQTRDITITSNSERTETITNHNNMLWWYEGCTGVKTGFTQQSLHCIVTSAKRGGIELIAVLLGNESSAAMWRDAPALLDHGFRIVRPVELLSRGQEVLRACPEGGQSELVGVAAEGFSILDAGNYPEVKVETVLDSEICAPVEEGQRVGAVTISQQGRLLAEIDVVAQQPVARVVSLGQTVSKILVVPATLGVALLALYINWRTRRKNKHRERAMRISERSRRYRGDGLQRYRSGDLR